MFQENHQPVLVSNLPSQLLNLQQLLKISLALHQHGSVASIFQVPAVQFLKRESGVSGEKRAENPTWWLIPLSGL